MIKTVLSILFAVSLLNAATGCDLAQVGDVELNLGGHGTFKKANYKAIAKSGKNFKTIFVGSVISIKSAKVEIVDIKADKRVKGQPRTGTITVNLDADNSIQNIVMLYNYDKGHFTAKGKQKNGKDISFALNIKAVLCSV